MILCNIVVIFSELLKLWVYLAWSKKQLILLLNKEKETGKLNNFTGLTFCKLQHQQLLIRTLLFLGLLPSIARHALQSENKF